MKKQLLTIGALALFAISGVQAQTVIFDKGTSWSYQDLDQAQPDAWKTKNYDISSWPVGNSPLGYGDPVTTIIHSGATELITAYFAKDITVNLASLSDNVELGIMRDDGIVVYLNGEEVVRDNMPAGIITFNTFSSTTIDGAAENVYNIFSIPKSKFVNGVNRISIELHNRSVSSSDLRIDAYLKTTSNTTPTPTPTPNPTVCNGTHISCFTSIVPTAQTNKLIIPAEHKYQLILKEGDNYTEGGGFVGGQNDFTAYVPKSGSSTNGYLSVNHETNPGGVTMAEVNYNTATKLWQLTRSRAVSFSDPSLVQTIRNCSGGITPWGTVITAEESVSANDSNGDGYKDYGWLVEIDPATAQVISKNANGTKGKLWQMGIMNHENVVINNAGTIAYYGEDGGTHMVYKYVMDTPNDLSSGNLYVLKLDQGLTAAGDPAGTTATWIQVPNKTQADQNNTNNLAKTLGGTKFNGIEDVDISPLDGKIYFTSKGLDRVYRLKDDGTTASQVETFVGGGSTVYSFDTPQGVKSEAWADGNDNLTFDELGNLWVLQDGGKNYIWVIAPDHTQANPKVRLFASMPAGSEPTGLTFTPDHKFGFFSIQHPDAAISTDVDATGNTIDYRGKSATVVIALKENLGAQGSLGTSENKTAENTVTVAPNPTSGMVKINSPKGLKGISVTVYSIDGKIVYTNKFNGINKTLDLDLTKQLEGSRVLILNIEAEGGFQQTVKLLKK